MKDPESPIIDMYPTDFALDMNGKKYEWMGVVLLPFLDEDRLHRIGWRFSKNFHENPLRDFFKKTQKLFKSYLKKMYKYSRSFQKLSKIFRNSSKSFQKFSEQKYN